MNSEERRRDAIKSRIAEMHYAVSRLDGPQDRRARYLRREIDDLLEECDEAVTAWRTLIDELRSLRRALPPQP